MFTDDTRIGACLEVIVTIRYLQIAVQIWGRIGSIDRSNLLL